MKAGIERRVNTVVAGVLAVIAYLYISAVFNVIVPHYSWSVPGALNLLVLTTTTATGLLCYLQCVFLDPGRVPPGWEPPEDPEAGAVVQVKRSGRRRYCNKCAAPKPPRCHHCRRCGRCVLRMDHHCVWVNGCIGHANYRAFLLMIAHLTAAAVHALGLFLALDSALVQLALGVDEDSKAWAAAAVGGAAGEAAGMEASVEWETGQASIGRRVGWQEPFWAHAMVQVAATAVALPIVVGLLLLLVWNLHLFSTNKTTIEHHEGVTAAQPGAPRAAANPFDLGSWYANAAAVCGEDVAMWPLPVEAAAKGDGLAFPSAWGGPATPGAVAE